ncbi:MAG: ribosome assembly cofactor RimP [Rikenellaceae bacterium]
MITVEKIESIVGDYVADSEVFVVDVKVSSQNVIEVLVDSNSGIDIDYCANLSKHIESCLDRDVEDFELTVASAGISDPFKKLAQYKKFSDREVEVKLADGSKLVGLMQDVTETGFSLSYEVKELIEGKKRKQIVEKKVDLLYADIKSTRLVIKF